MSFPDHGGNDVQVKEALAVPDTADHQRPISGSKITSVKPSQVIIAHQAPFLRAESHTLILGTTSYPSIHHEVYPKAVCHDVVCAYDNQVEKR